MSVANIQIYGNVSDKTNIYKPCPDVHKMKSRQQYNNQLYIGRYEYRSNAAST